MLPDPLQFTLDEPHHGSFRRMLTRHDARSAFDYDFDVDNSTLTTFLTCPRSFEFGTIYGRDTSYRDALNYGSAIHHALEHFYRHDALVEDVTASRRPSSVLDVLHEAFLDKPTDSDSWRTYEHAAESMRRYVRWHEQMPPWTLVEHDGSRAVELAFRLPLFVYEVGVADHPHIAPWPPTLVADAATGGVADLNASLGVTAVRRIHVNYTGKIDMIVEQDGALAVVDHKTTSIEGSTFWSQFNLSPQMIGYCWAASQLLDRPVRSAIIDALIGRKPTKTGIPHEYARQRYHYSAEQVDEWRADVECHVRTLLDNFMRGVFPRNTNSCYGKFPCQFRDVCPLPRNVQPTALRSGAFVPRTWSPLTTN